MIFAFADCELDVERRELRRLGCVTHLEPQVFDVLVYLMRHRDRVVSKHELLDAVWHGRSVSESTLTSRISAARRAIGDTGERQSQLRTIARRGFRFCGEIQERDAPQSPPARSAAREPSIELRKEATSGLRAQATSLLGRDNDLAQVAGLLRPSRLVTLTGVGGVGKTRLAIHVATQVAPNYPDGVWLVELAALRDPGAVSHAVAGVLGVAQQRGKTIDQSVVTALGGRRLLLVLDNCEHLVDAVASLAREILGRCPDVALLATSREALMLDGEQAWSVSPLGFDGIASPAVQLFVERARAVAHDFALSGDEAAVVEICSRLDGIPLAIELAAARIRAMSPSQIRDRLDERFRLLTGGSRGTDERHRTLRGVVQWSHDLLSPSERTVLSRASAFAGGFALEAAERVCGGGEVARNDVFDILDSLVRKSLVAVDRSGKVLRYGLLETIRQFAEEQLTKLGEAEAVRAQHAQFFAEDSATYFKIWLSPSQLAAYEWLDREMGNLRAAFRWARARAAVDIAAEIASNIGDMARFRMRDEAATWAEEVVDAARAIRHRRLAVLLTWAASTAWSVGRLDEAKGYGEEAIALAGDTGFDTFVWAFTDLAAVASYEGQVTRAVELARAGAEHAADRHDRFCLALLPYFLTVGGRSDEAITMADGIVAAVEAAGVPSSLSAALRAKGRAFAEADPAVALAAYDQAIAVARESGNRFWENLVIPQLAALQACNGNAVDALRSFERTLDLWRHSNDLVFVAHGLGSLIVLFDRLGRAEAAAILSGALTTTFESNAFVPNLADTLERARDMLGDGAFGEAARRGAAMGPRGGIAYALEQIRHALGALGVDTVDQ